MVGYIGSKASVTQVDGYNQAEADAEFVNDPNGAITVDSSNNVGIGRVPSVVESAYDSLQLGAGGTWLSGSSNFAAGNFGQNYYVDASGTNRYLGNDEAERIVLNNGFIAFETAPTNASGAGAALTWSESMRIDASGNVGIGASDVDSQLHIEKSNVTAYNGSATDGQLSAGATAFVQQTGGSNVALSQIVFQPRSGFGYNRIVNSGGSVPYMAFATNNSEAMRIDSSGNLLVGKTTTAISDDGVKIQPSGQVTITQDSADVLRVNRKTSDGTLIDLRKNGSTVCRIGNNGSRPYICSTGHGLYFGSTATLPTNGIGAPIDNSYDFGVSSYRWDDIYATNGTIQTSDRNEKQDIEALSDAEQRVAVACKGLLRKFRWIDSVAEKGDDARIHFGIIAQDLQDAFTAEGLDAGRYAMFISSTWWETQTDVPAVAAVAEVLDDDGNVVTEAVEAKDAYTRTDTYETLEEAPAGATERTRLGVRYPELLAFIIGAM